MLCKIDDVIFVSILITKNLIPSIVCFNKTIKVGNEIEISKNINDCVFSVKRNFIDNPDKKIIINSKNEVKSSVEITKEIFFLYLKNICDNFSKNKLMIVL